MGPKQNKKWFKDLKGKAVEKYRLGDFVGAGKIGYVYQSEHQDFPGSEWAVKLIFDQLKSGWDVEVKKVMSLALVPGVVHFHGLGAAQITHEGETRLCQYTVWDYISPGENLKRYLERVGNVHASFLISVVNQILHVLHACQIKGVKRHGDLHSGNILIGDPTTSTLDDSLEPRAPIFVSDFGYGATGAAKMPKDDYEGLGQIINEMIPRLDYAKTTSTDRQILQSLKCNFNKLINESTAVERQPPIDLLRLLKNILHQAQARDSQPTIIASGEADKTVPLVPGAKPTVGQFQVSEMIGDRWDWWRLLFVPTVPARSKILALDIPTVVTGPRGCGKTMLFRRLSERLVVECDDEHKFSTSGQFVAFYVNANDFGDAFAHFPNQPTPEDEAQLICYANICLLSDLLAVQSARAGRMNESATDELFCFVHSLLVPDESVIINFIAGENRLERYRTILEQIKWTFPFSGDDEKVFPGYSEMSQHRWLTLFVQQARKCCPWIAERYVLLFIDDYSTPRVSFAMQRVLNRLFLQRSSKFLAKIATEASSTFVPEDSSGKNLQDGDDYQLVDMGEEALFLPDKERLSFLNEVFSRRLKFDQRIPRGQNSLYSLLSRSTLSKTEFARRLRNVPNNKSGDGLVKVNGDSQRRGRSRGRVNYFGENVFSDLWSGDTRTMIQLITDLVDQASEATPRTVTSNEISLPVKTEAQDRVFRNRGGEWLNSQTRNEPTEPKRMKEELVRLQQQKSEYRLCGGGYGDHLKAVVEAFVAAAKALLLGPTYIIRGGKSSREVPRMAFRIEVVDEFRIDGLAQEIYRDLVRYGLFMRDNRGKSVRGTFVPRLYLRRLLLPFCALALSKRDSVQLTCEAFTQLLLEPDAFKKNYTARRKPVAKSSNQLPLFLSDPLPPEELDSAYDDLDDDNEEDEEL
jgi:hypothetical protein